MRLKLAQPLGSQRIRLVDAVHLDAVAAVRDMQAPVPRVPHLDRLRVQTVVPAAREDFDPAFGDNGELHVPGAPGVFVLFGHVLHGDGVPGEPAVGRAFDAFWTVVSAMFESVLMRWIVQIYLAIFHHRCMPIL